MDSKEIVIIGGGPAGLTAAIYAARYKLDTMVIAKEPGGLAAKAHKVCNFPSYQEITGFELMNRMSEQVRNLDVPISYDEVVSVDKSKGGFIASTKQGNEIFSKYVIYAAGTKWRTLKVPGEGKFLGKGVSYCATCDAAFFQDKDVAVIGGGDAALTAALLVAEYAKKVYIIYRKESFFRAEPAWVEIVENNKKIVPLFNEEVSEIKGDKFVEGVNLKSGKKLSLGGVFIEIGSDPITDPIKNLDVKTQNGYILTGIEQETNVPGLYAAGDITNTELKQIINAASQGSVAAFSIYKKLIKSDRK